MTNPPLTRVDLAIDVGTAFTRVVRRGSHAVVEARSIVPGDWDVPPLAHGVVADVATAAAVLRPLVRAASRWSLLKPRAVACIPTLASSDDRRKLEAVLCRAGVGAHCLVPEPLAAAIGAGVDVGLPFAQLVVDVGEGVTDAAVVRDGGVVDSRASRVGGATLANHLVGWLWDHRDVRVEPDEAARALVGLGSDQTGAVELDATHRWTGVRVRFSLPIHEAAFALRAVSITIGDVALSLMRAVDDRTGAELVENPVVLTGGCARLPWVAEAISTRLGLPVTVAEDPSRCVLRGAAQMFAPADASDLWRTLEC